MNLYYICDLASGLAINDQSHFICTGMPHFIVLCFIAPHRCCIFNKLKARPSTRRKDYNLLYCGGLEPNLQYIWGMSVAPSPFFPLINIHSFIYREWKGERERERMKHQCVRETWTGCLSAHNPGMCPD